MTISIDFLETFMSILTSVQRLISYAQTVVADKATLAQQLADTQKELAAALAVEASDTVTIADAVAKAEALQKVADDNAAKVVELQQTSATGNPEVENAIASIEAFLPTPVV